MKICKSLCHPHNITSLQYTRTHSSYSTYMFLGKF